MIGYERKRYVCPQCKNCEDNYKTLNHCYATCGYPMGILLAYENLQRKIMEEIDDEHDYLETRVTKEDSKNESR